MKEIRIIVNKLTNKEYNSIKEASLSSGQCISKISKQVRGVYNQSEGTCRYEESSEPIKIPNTSSKPKIKDINRIGEHKKSSTSDYGTGRCSECNERSLERYKLCINCLKGTRPARTATNQTTRNVRRNGTEFLINT